MNNIFGLNVNSNNKNLIAQDIEKRKIKYLFHFTPASNLDNIFQNGLLPRTILEKNNDDFAFNDAIRVDNHPDSLSISISFPNYKMFYKYRTAVNAPDMAVLALDPKIILDKDCAFYYENAARSTFNRNPASLYKNLNSWNEMFMDNFQGKTRISLNIPDYFTTNPQAEILVFDKIETKYIIATLFENKDVMEKYHPSIPKESNCQVLSVVFTPRSDFSQW